MSMEGGCGWSLWHSEGGRQYSWGALVVRSNCGGGSRNAGGRGCRDSVDSPASVQEVTN